MLKSRFYRFIISAVLSVILMIALVAFTSDTDPSRILTMLGGTMPENLPTPDKSLKESEKENKKINLKNM